MCVVYVCVCVGVVGGERENVAMRAKGLGNNLEISSGTKKFLLHILSDTSH